MSSSASMTTMRGVSIARPAPPARCFHPSPRSTPALLPTRRLISIITSAADPYVLTKMEEQERTFNELQNRMADPDISGNPTEYQRLVRAVSDIQNAVEAYIAYKDTEKQLTDAKDMVRESEGDVEMLEFAKEEVESLTTSLNEQGERLKVLLLPRIHWTTKTSCWKSVLELEVKKQLYGLLI